MVFQLTAKKKDDVNNRIWRRSSVQQKTAWLFKRKAQVVINQDNNDKPNGNVDADETLLRGYTKEHRGRSLEKRSRFNSSRAAL